jgi:hypothetical protein
MIGLLERFEEMCRRRRLNVPPHLRPAILGVLVTELQVNEQALKVSPEKLISVTAYSGAVGPALPKEFPDFADTPGTFRRAVVSNPTDPRGFLRRTQQTVAALAADEEFKTLTCFIIRFPR